MTRRSFGYVQDDERIQALRESLRGHDQRQYW